MTQLTAGELRAYLENVPDDAPVHILACGAVGDAKHVVKGPEGVLIKE